MKDKKIKKIYEYAKKNMAERKTLKEELSKSTDNEEKSLISARVSYLETLFIEVRDALNNLYKVVKEKGTDEEISVAKNRIYELYDELIDSKLEETEVEDIIEVSEKKKNNIWKNILIALGIIGISVGVTSCIAKNDKNNNTKNSNNVEIVEEAPKNSKTNEFEIVEDTETKTENEMSTILTDASNNKQVMDRAQEIYDKYIDLESVPEAAKKELSVEKLANVIRMCNGEFAIEDGNIEYNETIFDELGNTINAYHNATSFEQYGTNLEFKPTSVFFEDDSLAHDVALESDKLMSTVYDDIRANDIAKFQEDSIKWGEFLRDTVIYNDSTGKTISLWTIDNEQKYPLLKTLTSVYAPSILEYSLGVDLAVRDSQTNTFGDTFGICIPYCYNEHNELTSIPLSKMIYDINETPMNSLAERAGMYEEWKDNNESIMVQCGLTTQSWFNDKYDREVGYSKQLK